jgi:hypothetical protein
VGIFVLFMQVCGSFSNAVWERNDQETSFRKGRFVGFIATN